MKLKVDENLPVEVAALLRDGGHEADTVTGEGLSGLPDDALSARLQAEGRALITLDLDSSDIRRYAPADFPGIIVLRSKSQDKRTVMDLASRALPLLLTEPLAGHLWIVEPDRVRIR